MGRSPYNCWLRLTTERRAAGQVGTVVLPRPAKVPRGHARDAVNGGVCPTCPSVPHLFATGQLGIQYLGAHCVEPEAVRGAGNGQPGL